MPDPREIPCTCSVTADIIAALAGRPVPPCERHRPAAPDPGPDFELGDDDGLLASLGRVFGIGTFTTDPDDDLPSAA